MRFKIGDQVVRPIMGDGVKVYQVVAIGGNFIRRRYLVGVKNNDLYIDCSESELYACPQHMKLPDKRLTISTN